MRNLFENVEKEIFKYLLDLPNGWINKTLLYAPDITDVKGKKGFAGYGICKRLFDFSSLFD